MSDLFDLKQAVLDWRRQMAAGGIKTPDLLWAGFFLTLLSCAGVGLLLGGRHNRTLGTPRPAPNL